MGINTLLPFLKGATTEIFIGHYKEKNGCCGRFLLA